MRVLVLSTWFPYPLSQGSKIRAYYLTKSLAQKHEVALVSFADMPVEPSSLEHMEKICQKVQVVQRNPFESSRRKTLMGWLSPQPSVVQTSYSHEMAIRVQRLVEDWNPQSIVALTFVTAPYVLHIRQRLKKIVDIDNLMSPMLYHEYQQAQGAFGRFRRALAYWKFRRYETWLYQQFDLGLVVSDRDRVAAMNLFGLKEKQVVVIPNGVDTVLNQPLAIEPQPDTLVFNGALTYSANYDAMSFFLHEIFPLICAQVPNAHLTITGSTANVPVSKLSSKGQIIFSGYLADVRPTIAQSWVCVVPLRMGGGTRLKILEAMALGTPVVSTSKGAEGLDVENGKHLLIGDTPNEFATQTVRVLREPELRKLLAVRAAQFVKERYEWASIGQQLCEWVENV